MGDHQRTSAHVSLTAVGHLPPTDVSFIERAEAVEPVSVAALPSGMAVLHQHHTGMIVEDMDAALAFFELLGFETEKPSRISGDWVDRVNGLDGTEIDLAWVRVPDGSGAIELTKFVHPVDGNGDPTAPANRSGFRHLAFVVDDVDATVVTLAEAGYPVLREVVNFEDVYRLCYVRGPEGMIFELAQELGGAT